MLVVIKQRIGMNMSQLCVFHNIIYKFITVNDRLSPRGLICNFIFGGGGLFETTVKQVNRENKFILTFSIINRE